MKSTAIWIKNDLDAIKKTYCNWGAKEAILKLETKRNQF
jgi:hypothetical protein